MKRFTDCDGDSGLTPMAISGRDGIRRSRVLRSGRRVAVGLLLFASALSAAPRLVLSSSAIGPLYVGLGLGAVTDAEAFNAGDGTLNLTASTSAPWLAATIGASRPCVSRTGNCLPVSIVLNTTGLPIGSYLESVTLRDPNAVDSPQQIFVSVAIVGVPSSLAFYVTPSNGGVGSEADTIIYPASQISGTVTTTTGEKWLALTTRAPNGLAFGSPYYIQAAAQTSQTAGTYSGSVAVTGSSNAADNKTIGVTMTVTFSPIISVSYSTAVRLATDTGAAKASASVKFLNIGLGTLGITSASATSSTGSFLSAAVTAADTIEVTANPSGMAPGIYTGRVTITSNAANNSQISVPVTVTVSAAGTPVITTAGIVNVANFAQEPSSPGDILAVFGDQLAPVGSLAVNVGTPPLATILAGVQVLVNGVPAPLYFASPTQVNFQLPYEAGAGTTVQVVSNGKAGNIRSLNVVATAPRMMVWGPDLIIGGYGIIVNQDRSFTLPSTTKVAGFVTHPAKAGDTITIYAVGLGQTVPSAITGAPASSSPLRSVANAIVTFGGAFEGTTTAVPAYAGLTPSAVGLYQVNVEIPPATPIGAAVPVTLTINGVIGNFAYLAISQ